MQLEKQIADDKCTLLEKEIEVLNEKILKLKRKKLKKNKKRKFNDAGLGQKLKFDCFFSNIHSHKL